ncbi:Beta-glucosidase 12 [Apostasia shenzhenica]|uniref:Beta-glucosidase 12 n=1 Tax=Apostasia shenzhenica TaxID=1088818 RepID=A0A2I0AV87_9ASPA|nr:Beta-glucosidase 12 [Apostasia shenzhenica]
MSRSYIYNIQLQEDVQLVADIGLNSYRFSISWPRIFPKGRGTPNEEGVRYYHNLINELIRRGVQPFATIFHWDVPQALEDEYGGFLSRKIIEDYKNYVQFLFKEYGNKVKRWITFNEPQMFILRGYGNGMFAPGHCTPDLKIGDMEYVCPAGDSIREPYTVGHNMLLAHAEAVKIYKEQFLAGQQGEIGITLVTTWYEPYDDNPLDKEAQIRALDFNVGWIVDPLMFGDYPLSMRALVGERLPIFTKEESELLTSHKNDFIGINYYTARYAKHMPFDPNFRPKIYTEDGRYDTLTHRGDVPIGPAETDSWVNVYPKGLTKQLQCIRDRYNNIPVYITENGVLEYVQELEKLIAAGIVLSEPLEDIYRTEYLISHIQEVEDAIRDGVNVKGYFVWSLLDCFEWSDGYTARFGIVHIDYTNIKNPDLTRTPKGSASWLKRFLANKIKKQPKPVVYDVVPGIKKAQPGVVKV